jgi:hypothetical protein
MGESRRKADMLFFGGAYVCKADIPSKINKTKGTRFSRRPVKKHKVPVTDLD